MVLVLAPSSVTVGTINLMSREDSGVEWILYGDGFIGWGSADSTLAPKQKTRARGAWGGLSYDKDRPITLKGICTAPTAALASDALDRLIDSASLDETVLSVSESGRVRWCTVRRDGAVLPTWFGACAFEWSIQLVALDPRKFSAPITATTALPSSTGGTSFPVSFPMSFTATTVTGQVSILNPGNETGPVTIRLDGPFNGPIITHVGSGLRLVFAASASIGVGEFWDIDMESQSVLAQGQASRATWITSRQWFGLEPGNNTFALTAASSTTGFMTVTGTPAYK